MQILKTDAAFEALLQTERLLLVQFGAATCAPCKAIGQKLDAWLGEHPSVTAVYIPIEEFKALTGQLGIFTVPTIFIYAEGKLTVRASGYFSLEDVLRQLERYETLLFEV